MNTEEIKKKLNDYFNYIKTIYINEFSRYMTEDTKENIRQMNNIIELNDDLTFKISSEKKIVFNLDLPKYIEENKLKEESSLQDLNEYSKNYINYLVKNENNVFEVVKNKLLEQIILYLVQNKNDVVSVGTSTLICERLVEKYKLPYENIIPSKEKEVAKFIEQIIGEDTLLKGVINNNQTIISEKFDAYTEKDSYSKLINDLNKTYKDYRSKYGRIFLPDSLYEYEKINYILSKKTDIIKEQKTDDSIIKLKRLAAVKRALLNISSKKVLFSAHKQVELENNITEISKITKIIMKNQELNITGNIDKEYPKIFKIEEESKQFMNEIWYNFLTPLSSFANAMDFNFLIAKDIDKELVEASLLSSEMLNRIRNVDLGYGFICEVLEDGVLYASNKKFNYEVCQNENTDNLDIITLGDKKYLIDNPEETTLITPNMILNNSIKNKNTNNLILLDRKRIYPVGIYCFVDDDLENNSNYLKAIELTDDYNLPIIKINSFDYYKEKQQNLTKTL